jgi:RNA polymerase sigma-70 factor (ECF subfamily)
MLVDFHSLFGRYSQDVYRFALYLSGDPSLVEEITQETFVRAWVIPGETTKLQPIPYLWFRRQLRRSHASLREGPRRDDQGHDVGRPVSHGG